MQGKERLIANEENHNFNYYLGIKSLKSCNQLMPIFSHW